MEPSARSPADGGDLNGGRTAISTLTFGQDWDLDQLNNWANFTEDSDGNATDDLNQDRTHNDANEITDVTETTGPSWVTPAHDAAGNMTTVPQPAAPTTSYALTWDAWNRLVKVVDGANTVAEYEYDGSNRRIVKKVYDAGTLDETRHIYLSKRNQVLEERVDSSTDPDRQFTWGARYVDDLIMRTRDTDSNGTLDETLYALQDANWNVTALTDDSGTIVERFSYTPYGESTVLDANFTDDADGTSDYGWNYRFKSRQHDSESGLENFRMRYYHSGLGCFISRDPLQFVDGGNLYAGYFAPDATDPTGTRKITCKYHHVRSRRTTKKTVNCPGVADTCCKKNKPRSNSDPCRYVGWDRINTPAPPIPMPRYCDYLLSPCDMDRDLKYGFYGCTATAGGCLALAGGAYAWGAAGLPTFGAGVVATSETSVVFVVNGQVYLGASKGVYLITAAQWHQLGYWTSITGIPIINGQAAAAGAGGASLWFQNQPCLSHALQGLVNGWIK